MNSIVTQRIVHHLLEVALLRPCVVVILFFLSKKKFILALVFASVGL